MLLEFHRAPSVSVVIKKFQESLQDPGLATNSHAGLLSRPAPVNADRWDAPPLLCPSRLAGPPGPRTRSMTARCRSISSPPRPSRHASHRHMTRAPPIREHQMCLHQLDVPRKKPAPPMRERQLHHTAHSGTSTVSPPSGPLVQQTSTAHAGTPPALLLHASQVLGGSTVHAGTS